MAECNNFFYHHICHTCKIYFPDLKKCTGCKLVSYCSRTHQKKDWRNHKSLCTIFQDFYKVRNISSISVFAAENPNDWRKKCVALMCAIELKLGRHLKQFEKQMLWFQNLCPVCFTANVTKQHLCSDCNYICYCSSEHRSIHFKDHKRECSQLQICYEIDKIRFESVDVPVDLSIPTFEDSIFPDSLDSFLTKSNTCNEFSKIFQSEYLSGIFSMLHSIHSYLNSSVQEVFNIHIIGANRYEQTVIMHIELLFHRFPCLNKLIVVLIGPEVCSDYVGPVLCEECERNKILTLDTKKTLYHEYISSSEFSVPDLIFSFNCGFSEFSNTDNDSWKDSLKCIWKFSSVLLVFTSYTSSEAEMDLSAVMETKPSNVNVSPILKQNPFRSSRPSRNWEFSDCAVFYNNNYMTIINI